MLKYGLHVKGTEQEIKKAYVKYGVKCTQFFVCNPRSFKKIDINVEKIKKYCRKNKIKIFVHANYITNGLWNINKNNIKEKNKYIKLLKNQLDICDKLESEGLIIHLPKKKIIDIVNCLKLITIHLNQYNTSLILENPSVKPKKDNTYENPKKFNVLLKELNKIKIDWKLCIDSSHLWNSSVDIKTYEKTKYWFENFDYIDKIILFHLNGSFHNKNIFKDKHAIPFSENDKIWFDYKNNINKSGFNKFVELSKKKKINIIIEINRGLTKDMDYLFNILKNY